MVGAHRHLHLRVEGARGLDHLANAQRVAEWLDADDRVDWGRFAGLPEGAILEVTLDRPPANAVDLATSADDIPNGLLRPAAPAMPSVSTLIRPCRPAVA